MRCATWPWRCPYFQSALCGRTVHHTVVECSGGWGAVQLTGKTRPFAASRDAILNVAVDGLPLASFLSLAPFKMAASLDKVDLDAGLTVTFRQDSKGSSLHVQGQAALKTWPCTTRG